MASNAGNVLDNDTICTGLECHAVIAVRHLHVADGYVCAGTDVEAVCVLRIILAAGGGVHVQIEELGCLGVAFDGIEDVRGILLAEVGDLDVGAAGDIEQGRATVAAVFGEKVPAVRDVSDPK